MKFTRRQWLTRLAFYGSPVTAFGYGNVIEKRWIDVTRQEIPLPPAHAHLDDLKIAVMGDFHHDDFGDSELIGRAVKMINEEQVDLVMLVGDFVSEDVKALEPLCAELANLRPRFRSFAIYGNHDRWHADLELSNQLEEAGISLLSNEMVEFPDFVVAGLDSYWGGVPNVAQTFERAPKDKPILLGWHEPDPFDSIQDPRLVLQMSGHTHGGQICAPLYGPLLLPKYGKKYPHGHYQRGSSSLFVTRGIGTLTIPARFLCQPEVAVLTLRA